MHVNKKSVKSGQKDSFLKFTNNFLAVLIFAFTYHKKNKTEYGVEFHYYYWSPNQMDKATAIITKKVKSIII